MLNSAKNQVGFIKSVLKESYRLKEISENICDFVTTPIKKNSSTSKFYTKQKAQLLLEKSKNIPIGIPIFLMLTLGLRFGEAVSLIWSDVDLDKKNHTLVYVDNKIIFKDPKTPKSKRKLFAPDELISLLEEEKLKQNKLKLQGILKNEFDLICLNKRFNP
ncbi:TPA: site-specific integrase [Clostridioides difficile]|nr:site-specific integrase [Clostridioides difficile]